MQDDRRPAGSAAAARPFPVFWAGLAALTLAGGFLRFFALGSRDFWFDESCTFVYVHRLFDWPAESNLFAESTNLPYYFLLRIWADVLGHTEVAYRSLSALAATLTVPLLGVVGRRLGGSAVGIVCAGLVALNPLHIYYAHEARAYALWVLVLSVSVYCLCEAARRMSWRWWCAYGASVLFCLHLHYYTVYWLPCSVACVALGSQRRIVFRQWLITTIGVGLAFVPCFLIAVLPAAGAGGRAWLAGSWDPILSLPRTLWAFLPAGGYPGHLRGLSIHSPDTVLVGPEWLASVSRVLPAMVVLLAVALCALSRGRRSASRSGVIPRAGFVFAGGLAFGPLLLAWLSSMLLEPNYFSGRYDLVAFPGWVIWLALVLGRSGDLMWAARQRLVVGVVCAVLALCSLSPTVRFLGLTPPTSFHRVRAERVATLAGPNDLVLALSYDRYYLSYYLHRYGFRGSMASYPSWLDRQIGWLDTQADIAPSKRAELEADAKERAGLIEDSLEAGHRVFLLGDSTDARGDGPRRIIAETLLAHLGRRRIGGSMIDEHMMIVELSRAIPLEVE